MIPSSLQTAIKVGISGAMAYAIAQLFGFQLSFLAPIIAGNFSLAGLGLAWFAFPQLTLLLTVIIVVGVIEYYVLGNNYISIFINILFAGLLWRYLQLRGLVFAFLGLAIKFPTIIIMSSGSDKITMGYGMLGDILVGGIVGLIVGSLLWPTAIKDKLEKQLEEILNDSSLLCQQIFINYSKENFNDEEAQTLKGKILKSIQESKKLFKLSSYDITGHQLGKNDWKSILKTEENISIHLSAILRLIQTSKGVNLPPDLMTDLQQIGQSMIKCLSELKAVMIDHNQALDIEPLNQQFIQLRETLEDKRNTKQLTEIPLSELLSFYSFVHRLEKLINELNAWGKISAR